MSTRFYRPFSLGFAAIVATACSFAGAQGAPDNIQLVGANAVLVQNIDSKNATQGQAITAKLTSSVNPAGQELAKGTILVGHVEQVEPSNNGPSKLSLVFNQARLRDGRTIPVKTTVLSAYPANDDSYDGEASEAPEVVRVATAISDHESVDQEPGALGGNIAMHSAIKDGVSAVFTSKDHNIHLKRGTHFEIAIAPVSAQSEGTVAGQN